VDRANFLENPPPGIQYRIMEMDHVLPNPKRSKFIEWQYLETKDLFDFFIIRVINFRETDSVDLLHCANSVSVNNKPWIVSYEDFSSMISADNLGALDFIKLIIIKKFLGSKYCKFLVPWSEYSKRTTEQYIKNQTIRKKIKVVYPGVSLKKNTILGRLDKKPSNIKFLFIGNDYRRKGLPELLRAFNFLRLQYPGITLTIVGKIPDDFARKYKKGNMRFLGSLSRHNVAKEILKHHIFVLPTRTDSFGYSVLEAMSFGLPVITSNHSALPEMVKNGKNGLLLNTEFKPFAVPSLEQYKKNSGYNMCSEAIGKSIESELIKNMKVFIENTALIKRMGKKSLDISRDKFSYDKRNKLMGELYFRALQT